MVEVRDGAAVAAVVIDAVGDGHRLEVSAGVLVEEQAVVAGVVAVAPVDVRPAVVVEVEDASRVMMPSFQSAVLCVRARPVTSLPGRVEGDVGVLPVLKSISASSDDEPTSQCSISPWSRGPRLRRCRCRRTRGAAVAAEAERARDRWRGSSGRRRASTVHWMYVGGGHARAVRVARVELAPAARGLVVRPVLPRRRTRSRTPMLSVRERHRRGPGAAARGGSARGRTSRRAAPGVPSLSRSHAFAGPAVRVAEAFVRDRLRRRAHVLVVSPCGSVTSVKLPVPSPL